MNIKILKFISLYIAGFILLLHTVIPHYHSGDMLVTEEQPSFETSNSILDYVKVMFLSDLGDGHMDHFSSDNGPGDVVLEFDFMQSLFIPNSGLIFQYSNSEFSSEDIYYAGPAPPDLYLIQKHLRGPPIFC